MGNQRVGRVITGFCTISLRKNGSDFSMQRPFGALAVYSKWVDSKFVLTLQLFVVGC